MLPSRQRLDFVVVFSCFSGVHLFATPWTVARQVPLSMEYSRQEYWSELPCPSPGELPHPGIEPASLESPALAGRFFTSWGIRQAQGSSKNLLKMQTLDPHPRPAELETVGLSLENLLPGDSDAHWSLRTTVLFISQRVGKRNCSRAKGGDKDTVRALGAHPFQVGQALGTHVCLPPLGTLDIPKLLTSLSQSLTASFKPLA